MSIKIVKSLSKEMQNMEAAGLLRQEVPADTDNHYNVVVGENSKQQKLNFISNDFLAWQGNKAIQTAASRAVKDYGTGSTSSRASLGTSKLLHELEEKLCGFLNLKACVVLPSRYLSNVGLFDALTIERDHIFIDERSDPGLIDGARLTNAIVKSFRSRDYDNLKYHLKCSESARYRIIASDGVFDANGQLADLEQILELRERYDALTVIDDSLGICLTGENYRGSYDYSNVARPDILTGSFAYALGNVSGGFIGGRVALVEWLRQTSRSYIVSEPLSPVNAVVVMEAINILENDQSIIEALLVNVRDLKDKLLEHGWTLVDNQHPFVSIIIGSTLIVQKMVEMLFEQGILVKGLCYPNTDEGAAQIRIHVSAKHTIEQVDQLVEKLNGVKYLADSVETGAP